MSAPVVIVNPAAGGGVAAERGAVAAFRGLGIEPDIRRTAATGDAARLARDDRSDGPLFVIGGDGTVMEVVGALADSARAIGIIPGGTGNQLARHLRIPLDAGAAVRALHRASMRPFDLGRLSDGRHFAIAAGVGMDAAIIAGASPTLKRWLGVGAYVASGATSALAARRFAVRAVADGVAIERDAGLAMIANLGSVMGGRIAFGPGVRPDDGWLDLCIFTPRGIVDLAAILARLLRHDFRDDPRMLFVRARAIRLEVPSGVPAQADGEVLTTSVLDALVRPGAARFLAPAS
ncbi:MAG: diacylglycerol kinase family protein [Gemmatimonadaceae bacterium]